MADSFVIKACDRTRGMTQRHDGEVIVGWRIRVTFGDKTFEAPLAVDGRDFYEYELEATDAYNKYIAAGVGAEMRAVWGTVHPVRKAPGPKNPCRWHKDKNGYRRITVGDLEPVWGCADCTEKMVALGADISR